jgi:hypothetical protein
MLLPLFFSASVRYFRAVWDTALAIISNLRNDRERAVNKASTGPSACEDRTELKEKVLGGDYAILRG